MKTILLSSAIAGLLAAGVHAQMRGRAPAPNGERQAPAPVVVDWAEAARPTFADRPTAAPVPAPATGLATAIPNIDVVDAHWMALTMWGEARGQGEEAMRAVGHVIDNRRRSGLHGAYATEAVSEAFQFSCWNANDPNRQAMLGALDLPPESRDGRSWQAARRIADQILAGRSTDPTGGALFYHTTAVAPRWSQGMPIIARIGDHIFFRSAAVR